MSQVSDLFIEKREVPQISLYADDTIVCVCLIFNSQYPSLFNNELHTFMMIKSCCRVKQIFKIYKNVHLPVF